MVSTAEQVASGVAIGVGSAAKISAVTRAPSRRNLSQYAVDAAIA